MAQTKNTWRGRLLLRRARVAAPPVSMPLLSMRRKLAILVQIRVNLFPQTEPPDPNRPPETIGVSPDGNHIVYGVIDVQSNLLLLEGVKDVKR